jgi:serine/threonine protein kinase
MSGITKQEFAMKLPPDYPPQSDQYPFLQDSSHLTLIPSEQRGAAGAEVKIRDQDNPKKEFPPTGSSAPRVTLDFKLDFTIRFEDLRFGKLLGQGAYGEVFAGEWKFNPVAIKQYTAQDFSDQTREDIRKEASIMATVSAQSDYLVRLRGVILDKPNYSLVMEYLPGGDLFHLLKSGQEMTWPMRYRIGLDMTIGLHHLHGHGALHRDLKSLNVLLDMNCRAKLADFGLSTLKTSSASTTVGGFKGTVLWSAPELFRRGAKANTASDIYSLGMILWELVSRQIPFADAATPAIAATWVAQGDQEIVPEGTPEEFKGLILDCWDKDPAKRPQADAVAKRLDTLWQFEQKKTPTSPKDLSSISPESPKPAQAADSEGEMKKLQAEVMKLKLEKAEEERRRQELEKQVEEHARLKAEVEREREIKRREAELRKSPSAPKPESPASLPPAPQPGIKKPVTSEPVSPPSSVLSQSRFTIAPKPVIPRLDRGTQAIDQKALGQLLRFVAEGEQDKAEELIKKDKNLLLHTGNVTDLSGREFKQITAFQYALWALDWHMWKMIQKYLPEEQQREQFGALETKGTAHGKHFSFQPLIGALQVYVDNAEEVWNYDQRVRNHWCKVVGGAQREVPAHVVNEYCREDRSFDPCPAFTEEKLPRIRTSKYFPKASEWFTAEYNGKLCGESFAFARGWADNEGRSSSCDSARVVALAGTHGTAIDLKSLQSLSKARTQQLELLASQLKMSSYRPGFG